MAETETNSVDSEAIRRRLIILRQFVADGNQTAFAKRMGIEVKRWNNFERGSPLSKEIAILLVKRVPGLTLDWLYLGREEGLPTRLQRELATAQESVGPLSATKRG